MNVATPSSAGQHDDDTRRATADLGENRRCRAAGCRPGVSAVSAIGGRGWIDWWPRAESAVDDLDHRGRILRRRDRNHKIRNRDAH